MKEDNQYCYYSGLPSPLAYIDQSPINTTKQLTASDINRVIEMAWEDRTPFEAIKQQFNLRESDVKQLMKKQLRPGSYVAWRKRVENNTLKHRQRRSTKVLRFKSSLQKQISGNKISKRT
jgi:uncharacterized protein (TIGR03643 family)